MVIFSGFLRKTFSLSLAVILLFGFIGLYWLGNSKSGLNWLIQQTQVMAPGNLSITHVEGRLLDEIRLGNIHYQQEDGLELDIKQMAFSWHPMALINRTVNIQQLQLDNISITLPEQKNGNQKTPAKKTDINQLPTIELPLRVVINDIALNHLQVELKQAQQPSQLIEVERLHLQEINLQQHLSIQQAHLKLLAQDKIPGLVLDWKQDSRLISPYQTSLHLSWLADLPPGIIPEAQFPNGLKAQGELNAKGDLKHLNLEHKMLQPIPLQLQANIYDLLDKLHWNTNISWQEISWPLKTTPTAPQPDYPIIPEKEQLLLKQGLLLADGNLETYQMDLETQLQGKQIPNSLWKIQGNGDSKHFSIHHLKGELLGGEIKSHGLIQWQPEIKADLEVEMSSLQLQQLPENLSKQIPINTPLDSHISVLYNKQQLNIQNLELKLPQTGASIQLIGQISQLETAPQANIQVQWQALKWPIVDKTLPEEHSPLVESKKGTIDIKGGLDNYTLLLDTQVLGKDIPAGKWRGQIKGNQTSIQSFDIIGKLLKGQTHLIGNADWSEQPKWEVAIQGKGLRPETQWPELPGLLGFNIVHQGRLHKDQVNAHLLVKELKGKIKGYPIRLKADLNTDGSNHQLNKLAFYSGKNHINATAKINSTGNNTPPTINAKFKIDAPNIATFLPNAKGQIKGQGTIQGKLEQPQIKAKIKAKNIKFNEWQLASLKTDLSFDSQKEGQIKLRANLSQIKKDASTLVKTLSLTSDGQLKNHQITLKVDTAKENLDLLLVGDLDLTAKQWNGQIKQLQLGSDLLGQWHLTTASQLLLSEQNIDLSLSCFKAKEHVGKLCSALNWQKGQAIQVKAQLEQLSISQISEPFLPAEIGLTGLVLNAQVNAQLSERKIQAESSTMPNKLMDIASDVKLSLSPGKIFTLVEGRQYILPFKGAELDLGIDKSGLEGKINAHFFEKSSLSGNILLADLKQFPINPNQPIQANLKTKFLDLDIFPSLSPAIKNTTGFIDMNMNIGGDLNSPELQGQLLIQANTDIPDLGLQLRDIKTQINTDKTYKKLNIKGSLSSGKGINRFNGIVDLSNLTAWKAQIKLVGEMFQAINTDDFKAWISPNLSLNIQPGELEIDGQLKIPKALITPQVNFQAGGSKVNASSDAVIVDDKYTQLAEPEKTWKLKGKLDLQLGNNIQIDVADFKSRMEGQVNILFNPEHLIPNGQGEINIVDGTYKAYGQDLEISQGRIFFQGTPMDNPGLGIRAIRRIKNNAFNAVDVAGIDIRGTAKSPRLSLFSDPKVPDSDIISYIVTGSAISGESIESRELSLGTYISPSFYVSLGYDLFEGNKSFNLRYDISNKWGIEGLVGDRDSGVDFSFTLGREE